jgi:protoporphyrinogen IX oxidase
MRWLEAFHVVFVVTWFAGLFYLPRLFVYHASAADAPGRERFHIMERRLYAIMSIGASIAMLLGLAMVLASPAYLLLGWMRVKLVLVALLIAYHLGCGWLLRDLAAGKARSPRWYRWFNEVPGLFLIAICVLAIVQPELP